MNKQTRIILVTVATLLSLIGAASQVNVKFDIIYPDPTFPREYGLVLSNDNYTAMQNNVGIFTVKNKQVLIEGSPTFEQPNTNYCPLAKKIWDSHTIPYPEIQERFKKYMLPDWCLPEIYPIKVVNLKETLYITDGTIVDIPEFDNIGIVLLAIAIVSVIIVSAKSKVGLSK